MKHRNNNEFGRPFCQPNQKKIDKQTFGNISAELLEKALPSMAEDIRFTRKTFHCFDTRYLRYLCTIKEIFRYFTKNAFASQPTSGLLL